MSEPSTEDHHTSDPERRPKLEGGCCYGPAMAPSIRQATALHTTDILTRLFLSFLHEGMLSNFHEVSATLWNPVFFLHFLVNFIFL